MSASWWSGLPPVEAECQCGGETHTLRWSDGRLSALEHPDFEGERLLAALGGEVEGCIEVLAAWPLHAGSAVLFATSPYSDLDELHLDAGRLAAVATQLQLYLTIERRHQQRSGYVGPSLQFPGAYSSTSPAAPLAAPHSASGRAGMSRMVFARRGRGAGLQQLQQWLAQMLTASGTDHWPWSDLFHLLCLPRPFVDRLVLESFAKRAGDLALAAAALAPATPNGSAAEPAPSSTAAAPSAADAALSADAAPSADATRSADATLPADAAALYAAAASRVRGAIHLWLTEQARGDVPPIAVTLLPGPGPVAITPAPAHEPGLGGTDRGELLEVTVGTDWVTDVWARQMSVVDGYLVTELVGVDGEEALVRALRHPGPRFSDHPRTVELVRRATADAWTVAGR